MRTAIAALLKAEPGIELVGEAANFRETLALTETLKPDILLLDLRMPDEREYSAQFVKSKIVNNAGCIIAISVWNDEHAIILAKSFGASILLDKAKLVSELMPTIRQSYSNSAQSIIGGV